MRTKNTIKKSIYIKPEINDKIVRYCDTKGLKQNYLINKIVLDYFNNVLV